MREHLKDIRHVEKQINENENVFSIPKIFCNPVNETPCKRKHNQT